DSFETINLLEGLVEKDWFTFLYLGLAYEDLNNHSKAISNYLRSLNRNPNSIALYRLGKIYYKKNNFRKAIFFFSRLLKFDPSIRLANYYLGEALAKIGDFKDAYNYLSKSTNFYPQNLKLRSDFTKVKNKLGEDFFKELKIALEKARKKVLLLFYQKEKEIPLVRIGIAKNLNKVSFKCGGDFLFSDSKKKFKGKKDIIYTLVYKKDKVLLFSDNEILENFICPLRLESKGYPFYIFELNYGEGNFWTKTIDRAYRGDFEILSKNNGLVLVNILSIEEYLYGVIPAEIPPSSDLEALKAQAVASRTHLLKNLGRHKEEGFDLCADFHCQVYQGFSIENETTNLAVKETRGEVLIYNDKLVDIFYHANCGGCLRCCAFGENNFLVNKFDSFEEKLKNKYNSAYGEEIWFTEKPKTFCASDKSSFRWQRIYDSEDFNLIFSFPIEDLKEVKFIKKDSCFHYNEVEIITLKEKKNIKGDLNIRNYFDKLRSSAFKFEIKFSTDKKPQIIFFWGGGFGHASGLCQEGSINMAKMGYNYREILKYYYPKFRLKKIY
ncbi:MAG: SpoIID/LytB domain-containing protein, partial [Candidatus Aenigmatarchaeota archaeon]